MDLRQSKQVFKRYRAAKEKVRDLECELDNINITLSYSECISSSSISDRTFKEADKRIKNEVKLKGLKLYCKLVEDSLGELEDIEQEALYLYHIKGLSMENTGLRLGYSTAKPIIHKAHAKLSIALESIYIKPNKTIQ